MKRKNIYGYIFAAPWIIGFFIFTAYPIFYSLYLSFNKVKITADSGIITQFVKFDNYKYAFFTDVSFLNALVTFFIQLILSVPIIVVFALIISLLLNSKIKFKGIFRTIFFLPVVITSGPVINELVSQGATKIPGMADLVDINNLTKSLPLIISQPLNYIFSNIISILWFSGIQILIFLSGLQKMDVNAYEAAKIDGATMWEIFWKITLPSIKPLIVVNIIYTVILLSNFELNPISSIIKINMFKLETGFGYAAALAWLYLIFILIILGVYALFALRGTSD
ncbi:sugar ABC transporter permease [Thermoanaerobacter sp. A7A]|uniref:carbohydrate ABC transporter permease n=1 Tax=Thermoanaerobacter sp. A7A TaxID=1350366 RepID=UPI000427D5EB|nr:sugar ABC transporter permease [Thermoanaerobacter sp. A7A]